MAVDAGTLQKLAVISFLPSATAFLPAPPQPPLFFSTMN